MGKQRFSIVIIALSLFCMAILSSCSKGADKQTTIRIGEVTRSLFYAPQYVAIEKGFFKDQGIDIILTTTPGGDKTMTSLLSNVIDVALVGSETSIYVHQQGSDDPVINFAQITQTDGTFLVAREKIDSFDWNMLRNSVFLGQRKGGMPQMSGEFTLKKYNIDPHKDLELIQNIDFANIAPAFSSGTGEYVQLFEPTASIFEKEGIGHVIASFGTESGHLPYTVFMTKESYIKKNKDVIQAFTNAVYKAQQWVAENDAAAIAEAVAPYFENVDKEIMISSIQRYKEQGSFATDPIVDEAEWNNLLDVMISAGELSKRTEHSEIVNTSFAEKAIK